MHARSSWVTSACRCLPCFFQRLAHANILINPIATRYNAGPLYASNQ